jgi:predicted outer membrane protein
MGKTKRNIKHVEKVTHPTVTTLTRVMMYKPNGATVASVLEHLLLEIVQACPAEFEKEYVEHEVTYHTQMGSIVFRFRK